MTCRDRHWFTLYGQPGYRVSRCVRCGTPNPKWSSQRPQMVEMYGEDQVGADEAARNDRARRTRCP